jgi:prepilin-type processing-associated H-X9-DG protein
MVNVAWLDGHVKSEKPGKLEANAALENGKRLNSGIDRFLYWNLR